MSPLQQRGGAQPRADAYFGARASFYDDRYDRLDADGHALGARLAATLAFAGSGPGRALDVGMGPGRLCAELATRGWEVSGSDASPEMVEIARGRLPEAAERLIAARIEELPFRDESFDLVTATGVLEYAEIRLALAEIARVLRPGGRAVVSYPNPDALYGIWKSRVWYRAVRTAKRLLHRSFPDLPRGGPRIRPGRFREHLHDAGLELVSSSHTSALLLPTPLDLVLPRAAARLGRRLEGRAGRSTTRLATQVVYLARKEST